MNIYFCPYLNRDVLLSDERYEHIKNHHPEMLPEYEYSLAETIKNPDSIRNSSRFQNALLFTKYYDNIREGKYIVVVVVNEIHPEPRDWIITAYITRKLQNGVIKWKKK
jgi:hypothetical protein